MKKNTRETKFRKIQDRKSRREKQYRGIAINNNKEESQPCTIRRQLQYTSIITVVKKWNKDTIVNTNQEKLYQNHLGRARGFHGRTCYCSISYMVGNTKKYSES